MRSLFSTIGQNKIKYPEGSITECIPTIGKQSYNNHVSLLKKIKRANKTGSHGKEKN